MTVVSGIHGGRLHHLGLHFPGLAGSGDYGKTMSATLTLKEYTKSDVGAHGGRRTLFFR
jgi:hypothetical protein